MLAKAGRRRVRPSSGTSTTGGIAKRWRLLRTKATNSPYIHQR